MVSRDPVQDKLQGCNLYRELEIIKLSCLHIYFLKVSLLLFICINNRTG
jgi:hypothetical protein